MIPGTQKEAFFFLQILSGCLTKMPFLGAAFYSGDGGVQPSSASRFGKNVMRRFTKGNFGISTVALAQHVMKGVLLGKGGWSFVFFGGW